MESVKINENSLGGVHRCLKAIIHRLLNTIMTMGTTMAIPTVAIASIHTITITITIAATFIVMFIVTTTVIHTVMTMVRTVAAMLDMTMHPEHRVTALWSP